jgi:hypothetical protein
VDTGPIRTRTFNFVDGGVKPAPTYSDNREAVHAMIQEAITKNLARAVTRVPPGGDVTMAYLDILGNDVFTTSINDYFGYSDDVVSFLFPDRSAEIPPSQPSRQNTPTDPSPTTAITLRTAG